MEKFDQWIKDGHVPICSVQGKPYMFTNLRIDRKTIPEGLYAYDVRDECDGEFWQIKPKVVVNHWATIIGKLPIALDERGTYWSEPDPCDESFSSEGAFIGKEVDSVEEYLEKFEEYLVMARVEYSIIDTDSVLAFYDDNLKVSFENIGEGLNGDYDPNDPKDVNLLRFYVERRDNVYSPWEEVEDASYCTLLRASTPFDDLLEKLKVIWNRYKIAMELYPDVSVKKLGEELSWISTI